MPRKSLVPRLLAAAALFAVPAVRGYLLMPSNSLMPPLLAAAALFAVPDVRGYFILSQARRELLYAEEGYTLNSTDIYLTLSDQLECGCRKACEVHAKCNHSAFDSVTNKCHLTDKPKPWLVVQPGAIFLRRIKPSSDGLYYIVNNREKFMYDDAVARCASIPGFRIAQAKTRANVEAMISHFEDVLNWNGYDFIGLIKQSDGSYIWQDGTSVDMSVFTTGEPALKSPEGAGLFTIGPSEIVEIHVGTGPASMYGCLCQANFNYLVW